MTAVLIVTPVLVESDDSSVPLAHRALSGARLTTEEGKVSDFSLLSPSLLSPSLLSPSLLSLLSLSLLSPSLLSLSLSLLSLSLLSLSLLSLSCLGPQACVHSVTFLSKLLFCSSKQL